MPDFFNAAEYLVARHVDEGRGERVALTGPGGTRTYAQLGVAVERFATGLRALDIRPEERVLLFTADGPEMVTALLGTMRAGSVAVPVSTMLTASDLADVLADSRARVLVVGADFAAVAGDALKAAADDLRHVVPLPGAVVDAPPHVTVTEYAGLLAAGESAGSVEPAFRTWADSPALWLYTSGTTGKPKAAMHRHGSIRAVAETYAAQVLGIRPDDRCFSVAKLFFAYGIGNSLFFPFSVGATSVLEPGRATPSLAAERLTADRPTLFFGSPAFFSAMLAAEVPVEAFDGVRLAVSAGETLPAALQQRFTKRYGVPILDGIGSTEALHIFLSNQPGDIQPGTTGRAVPGFELRLVDDDDHEVPDETPGTLLVKGPSIATGYWCRDAVTRQVFRGEWLRTGDTYVRSRDGYYSCLGRAVDLIKASGIWVSPAEVETRLLEHPAVLRAVVVGARDAEGLETPVACVVRAPGAAVDSGELVEFCKQGLASYKRPRHVLFIDELPTNANGKVQRFRLRALAAAALGTPSQSGPGSPRLPV